MCTKSPRGFTLIELLIVVAVIGILAAIAIPGLLRARVSSNEASAIGSTRAIVSAQQDYQALNRAFATSLTVLNTTCAAVTTPFIGSDLRANGATKNGYIFSVGPGLGTAAGPVDMCGAATDQTFYATAVPAQVGVTGSRGFASDAGLVVWQDVAGAAPLQPFTASGTVSPIGK